MTGKNFCTSAKNAFFLIVRNPLKFGLVETIGEIFIFVGKLFISLLTTFCCYMVITRVSKFSKDLFSPILPTIFFFVISYTIGVLFMTVYGMASSCIL